MKVDDSSPSPDTRTPSDAVPRRSVWALVLVVCLSLPGASFLAVQGTGSVLGMLGWSPTSPAWYGMLMETAEWALLTPASTPAALLVAWVTRGKVSRTAARLAWFVALAALWGTLWYWGVALVPPV